MTWARTLGLASLLQPWYHRAECAKPFVDHEWFHLERTSSRRWQLEAMQTRGYLVDLLQGEKRAKAVCARCPVRRECLEANLHDAWGIWGGTTPLERRWYLKHYDDERVVEALLDAMDRQAIDIGLRRRD